MKNLMLDIETLGVDPGAVILSIAMVEFDLSTGATGREFFWKINLEDSMKNGFIINPKTLKWWLGQNIEVFKQNIELTKAELPNSTIKQVMLEIRNVFMYSLASGIEVWGNSNRFDLGILIPYLQSQGHNNLWSYSNERDVRTLVALNPDIKGKVLEKAKLDNLDLHNPIVDCKVQIDYCSQIFRSLKGNSI